MIKKLKPEIKEIYANDMIWQNKRYSISDLLIPRGTVELHIDLAIILDEHLKEFFRLNPSAKKPSNWGMSFRQQCKALGEYLRLSTKERMRQTTAFYGFSFQAFDEKLDHSINKGLINQSRGSSNQQILALIDNGGYKWVNNIHHLQLVVVAGKYPTISHMVYDLINMLPSANRPKNWNHSVFGKNNKIKDKFVDIVCRGKKTYLG